VSLGDGWRLQEPIHHHLRRASQSTRPARTSRGARTVPREQAGTLGGREAGRQRARAGAGDAKGGTGG